MTVWHKCSLRVALLSGLICTSAFWPSSSASQTVCRQALALGLDVSGSVDSREYRMQLNGLAAALTHTEVADALLSMPGTRVEISVFEWSGPQDQVLISGWTPITSAAQLDQLAASLRATTRTPAEQSTGLGQAMLFGGSLLQQRSDCWKRTLDISGDGESNTGVHPRDVVGRAALGDVTVNALVIGADALDHGDNRQADIAALSSYFRAYVIRGPDSFVEVALGFEDYERAMVRKLKRELQHFALSMGLSTGSASHIASQGINSQ